MTQSLDWKTETLRFTFLGCPDASADLVSWSAITGRDADSVTLKKALGTRNEEGAWAGGHLTVSVQQGRIDITLNAAPEETSSGIPDFPSLGSLRPVAEQLRDSLTKMKLPKSARLAVGAKMNSFSKSPSDSLVMLKKCLPNIAVDESCIDVIFQQNKPKKMRPSGIEINKICKWSQVSMHFLKFAPTEGQMPPDANFNVKHALQFDIDVNTSMTAQLPHQDSYGKLVEGLFSEVMSTLPEAN